jgi:endo-1,4-beta-D-glucanase Y
LSGCTSIGSRSHIRAASEAVAAFREVEDIRASEEGAVEIVRQGSGITPELLNEFAAANAGMLASIDWEQVRAVVTKLYATEFSERELKELLRFRRSPTGKKVTLFFSDDFRIRLRDAVGVAMAPQLERRQRKIEEIAKKRDSADAARR